MKAFVSLTSASLREFTRDRTSLSFTVILPLLLVAFFGFAFGTSSQKLTLGIAYLNGSSTSPLPVPADVEAGILRLQRDPRIVVEIGSASREQTRFRDGSIQAILELDAPVHSLRLSYDKSDGTIALAVESIEHVLAGANSISASLLSYHPELVPVSGLTNSRLDYVVPGILATALMWLGIFAAIPLVQQREQQVLRRLAVTPVTRAAVVLAQVVSRLVVSLAQAVFVLLAARLIFGVPVGSRVGSSLGSVLVIGALVLFGATAFVSIGYAVAALSSTQSSAHAWAQLLTMPMLVLAGVFFPISAMPVLLRPVAAILPLTYLADALRQTSANVEVFAPLVVDVVVLAAWIIGSLAIAIRYFRWSQ